MNALSSGGLVTMTKCSFDHIFAHCDASNVVLMYRSFLVELLYSSDHILLYVLVPLVSVHNK